MRHVPIVKFFERQAELRTKRFKRDLTQSRETKDMIRGRKHRRQIVNQRARPVKNDIANHEISLCRKSRSPQGEADCRTSNPLLAEVASPRNLRSDESRKHRFAYGAPAELSAAAFESIS